MRTCRAETLRGECTGTLLFDSTVKKNEPFCYYHRKLKAGLLQPVHEYLTAAEIEITLGGRPRNDGRRIDVYALET